MMDVQEVDEEKCPRQLASQLRLDVAASLKNNGANIKAPCPMADSIFEMLFGRIWMQSKVIRGNKLNEQIFERIKLDHDATLEFYRQRRESTLRKEVFEEDDEELQELQLAVEKAQSELDGLHKNLSEVQEQEKAEMATWLSQYGVERLVHSERISVLKSRGERIADRVDQLDEDRDLLAASQDFLGWIQSV